MLWINVIILELLSLILFVLLVICFVSNPALKLMKNFVFVAAISKDETDETRSRVPTKLPFNGYSDEFLDRLEPNGNIPAEKDLRYGKQILL